MDWRAPAARPFYQATPVDRRGAVLRRHLFTSGRAVTHLEDDVLDLDGLSASGQVALSGEGALLAALKAGRTGRMGDIVSTIQVEQDRIIRGDLPGVMVVQGGPGTGKTAVALHRAAYLLYTHRERLERSGCCSWARARCSCATSRRLFWIQQFLTRLRLTSYSRQMCGCSQLKRKQIRNLTISGGMV